MLTLPCAASRPTHTGNGVSGCPVHGDTASTVKAQIGEGPVMGSVLLTADVNGTWLYISDVGCGLSRVRLAAPYTIEVLVNKSVITSLAGGVTYSGMAPALNEVGTAVYLALQDDTNAGYRILKHSLLNGTTTIAVGNKTSGFVTADYADGLVGTAASARPYMLATGAAGFEVFWLDSGSSSLLSMIRGLLPDGTVSRACVALKRCTSASTAG